MKMKYKTQLCMAKSAWVGTPARKAVFPAQFWMIFANQKCKGFSLSVPIRPVFFQSSVPLSILMNFNLILTCQCWGHFPAWAVCQQRLYLLISLAKSPWAEFAFFEATISHLSCFVFLCTIAHIQICGVFQGQCQLF